MDTTEVVPSSPSSKIVVHLEFTTIDEFVTFWNTVVYPRSINQGDENIVVKEITTDSSVLAESLRKLVAISK